MTGANNLDEYSEADVDRGFCPEMRKGRETKWFTQPSPRATSPNKLFLFVLTLPSSFRLLLPLYARLLVVLSFAQLVLCTLAGILALKTTKGTV